MTTIHAIHNVTGPTLTIPMPAEFAGQQVEVEIRIVPKKTEPWGEGLKRCADILADVPEWDAIMAEIYQERKNDTRKEIPE